MYMGKGCSVHVHGLWYMLHYNWKNKMNMCFKKSDIAFNHEPTYWFQFFVVLLVVLKAESLSIWSYFIVNNYKTKTHMVVIDRSSVNNCYM